MTDLQPTCSSCASRTGRLKRGTSACSEGPTPGIFSHSGIETLCLCSKAPNPRSSLVLSLKEIKELKHGERDAHDELLPAPASYLVHSSSPGTRPHTDRTGVYQRPWTGRRSPRADTSRLRHKDTLSWASRQPAEPRLCFSPEPSKDDHDEEKETSKSARPPLPDESCGDKEAPGIHLSEQKVRW